MLLIFFGFIGVMFEAFGVAIFLPLVEGSNEPSRVGQIITDVLDYVGLGTGLGVILLLIAFAFVARAVFLGFQAIYFGRLRGDILVVLRRRVVRQIFDTDYAYYARQEVGWVSNIITNEYDQLSISINSFLTATTAIFFAIFYLVFPLALSTWVTLGALAAGVPLLLVVRWANIASVRYSIDITENTGALQQRVIQVLSNYRYLKATASNNVVVQHLDDVSSRLSTSIRKQIVVHALGTHGFPPIVVVVVFGLLFIQVEVLNTPLLESLFILFLLRRAMDQLVAAQGAYRIFLSYQGSFQAFSDFDRDLDAHVEPTRTNGSLEPEFDQDIRFVNVGYRYEGREFELKNVNLTIPAKTTVALVGASGSGKSTVGLLLVGVLRPESGNVKLGDQNIQNFDHRTYRRNIGFVTQESVIFNDTIENNISLWATDKDRHALTNVARLARVDEFVREMPDGYGTTLGDNGALVSGGQRQRIALARELYKGVKVLILDEATSALDSESEAAIQQNIDDLKGEQTIVIITHRLSTIRNVDLVYFFENGKLLNQGTYGELYRQEPKFRQMVDLQMVRVNQSEAYDR